ncbi:type II secretion system protein [Magnetococcus sp. PR-3]|uniref:type II secretion system protein n=1 Tax=Magnetococcus sp. PR-3 TaxID=3120355 RepID=UPI002FCE0F66
MSGRSIYRHSQAGFTMIELSMVLVIVGLIIAASISLIPGTRQTLELKETKSILREMKAAIIGFAAANGRLPCPDTDAVPDGAENRADPNCTSDVGVFPYRTLGLGTGVDAWGGHVVYGIHDGGGADNDLTDSTTPMCDVASNLRNLATSDALNLNTGVRISEMVNQELQTPTINFSCTDADSMGVAFVLVSKGFVDANESNDGADVYHQRFDGNNESLNGNAGALETNCFDSPERRWYTPEVAVNDSYDDVVAVMGFTSLYAKACLTD